MKFSIGSELVRFHGCESPTAWEGLYQNYDDWKRIVCRESYSHPAKMSPVLCEKIFEHLEVLQLIDHETSTVVDFMSGTATTNIIAGIRGYRSVSVELEPRFVRMQMKNREGLAAYTGREPDWKIMQGDARNLSKMFNGEDGRAGVTSPPYYGAEIDGREDWFKVHHPKDGSRPPGMANTVTARYSKGNIAKLPGKLAITSPPYGKGEDRLKNPIASYLKEKTLRSSGYETSNLKSKGQIQNLPVKLSGITSPPYLEAQKSEGISSDALGRDGYRNPDGSYDTGIIKRNRYRAEPFGPRNISRLGVISPPYQDVVHSPGENERQKEWTKRKSLESAGGARYGMNKANIGNLPGLVSPPYHKQGEVPRPDDPFFKKSPITAKSAGNIGLISPPYSNRLDPGNEKQRKKAGTLQNQVNLGGYGGRKDNIGNARLARLTSPPYVNIIGGSGEGPGATTKSNPHGHSSSPNSYGKTSGNIGNLSAITSPPYQNMASSAKSPNRAARLEKAGFNPESYMGGTGRQLDTDIRYSSSAENAGNLVPEDYSSAMLKVYSEARKAGISPLVTVTKNPTRKGKLVRLDLMTADLLVRAGYEIFDYHQATLVNIQKEREITLDFSEPSERTTAKGRLGFFKRLQLQKGGIVAQWEDVIFARVPN